MNLVQRQLNHFFKKPVYSRASEKKLKIHASLCIHRTIDSLAMDSLIKLLCWPDPKVVFSRTSGDALIDRARCQEASMFLNTDADVLLFVDDDIRYEPQDAIRICKEAHERQTIVGATYVIKKEEYTWITAKPLHTNQVIYFSKNDDLVEVKWLATGFMAIPRKILTEMIEKLELPLCHPTDLKFYPFFLPMVYKVENGDSIYLSEDWAFCERARQCGFKIYLDPSIRLGHSGRYTYELSDMARPAREKCEVIKYSENIDYNDTSKDMGENAVGQISA